jgi:site-specific DNA recombinase
MNNKQVAIYARVSSEQQADAGTVESQLESLRARVKAEGFALLAELEFVDDGYSGSTLVRPALERLRDGIAAGSIDQVYLHSPDRLARKYAYQMILVEEFQRAGTEVIFLNRHVGETPEDQLLLQVQGVVAEYERAKILERSRRGKIYSARRGSTNVLTKAPFGYRYITKHEGDGDSRLEVVFEEARVVQRIFEWVGQERVSLQEVCVRLGDMGVKTRSGGSCWDRSTVWGILQNTAYIGKAAYGKTRRTETRQRIRPMRGAPEHSKRLSPRQDLPEEEWIFIPVPPLVKVELFDAVKEQLDENRVRAREGQGKAKNLLQGLMVCASCRYAYCVTTSSGRKYRYYACAPQGVETSCQHRSLPADAVEEAVWREVKTLLESPQRLEREHQRRLGKSENSGEKLTEVGTQQGKFKRTIARLIDSYSEGLISKAEFEPRIRQQKKKLEGLEKQMRVLSEEQNAKQQLKLLIVQLADFRSRIDNKLATADFEVKRDLIRMLVRRVETDQTKLNVLFRVGTSPFALAPKGANLQDCRNRATRPYSLIK